MAPRLQCLRAVQDVTQTARCFRATFSSTTRGMEDRPFAARGLLNLDNARNPPAKDKGIQLSTSGPVSRQQKRIEAMKAMSAAQMSPAQRLLQRRPNGEQHESMEEVHRASLAKDLTQQLKRRWKSGEIYAPHDLSPEELRKWRTKMRNNFDVFDLLDMNPIDEYKNFSIMSEFMTPMGRIKGGNTNGLRPVNQRKIAKAIRRSIGLGMMPSVHRHPELLMKYAKKNEALLDKQRGQSKPEF